jgi:hypothetical protein
MAARTTKTPVAGQAFDEFLDGQLADPAFKAGFEKRLAKGQEHRRDAPGRRAGPRARESPQGRDRQTHESQAEAISRLLRGEGSNPTLDTLIDAIGLELDIRIKRQPAKRCVDYSPLKIHTTV